MRITQKEIAKELGVSLISVSRALNGKGYVSKELKKRVLEYAQSRNYVPHKASQVLVRNKVKRIVAFSSSLPNYFWNDIGNGINIAAEQLVHFNYQVIYHTLPEEDTESYIRILKEEIGKGLDAVALVNQRKYDMSVILGILDREGIPFVTFNVDAADSKRLCYIGSDYKSGGNLAANFIGKSLQFKKDAVTVVLQLEDQIRKYSYESPDINSERMKGFMESMKDDYPEITVLVEYFTSPFLPGPTDDQIECILKKHEGTVDAVYLIPAFNTTFLHVLEKLDYRKSLTVLHDIESSAIHHLETHLLTAAIYQNPILQGYYAIKTLEHILDSEKYERRNDIEIIHNLVLRENRNLFKNHLAITQLLE